MKSSVAQHEGLTMVRVEEDGPCCNVYLFLERSSFWTTTFSLDGGLDKGGVEMLGKSCIALLAQIFHPGAEQVFFDTARLE